MDEIAGKIALYHRLFLCCLILSVLCLILAVVLFFILDMKSVLGYLTGRQKRRKVKEMEAANAVSGRLISRKFTPMQHVAQEMKEDMGIRQTAKPGARKVEHVVSESPPETVLLTEKEPLYNEEEASTVALDRNPVQKGAFRIERELILIHTEEVI